MQVNNGIEFDENEPASQFQSYGRRRGSCCKSVMVRREVPSLNAVAGKCSAQCLSRDFTPSFQYEALQVGD